MVARWVNASCVVFLVDLPSEFSNRNHPISHISSILAQGNKKLAIRRETIPVIPNTSTVS